MKTILFTLLFLTFSVLGLQAQNQKAAASTIIKLEAPKVVPSIAKQLEAGTFIGIDPNEPLRMGNPKRAGANMTVPGKGLPKGDDALVNKQQRVAKKAGREPSLVFDANVSSYTPSDATGAVGPNHYLGGWNVGFRVFDKSGNPLMPAASLSTIFPGNNAGDPIMLYDAEADRYILTEFDQSPNGFNFAISAGPDPVNDDWYVYTTGMTTGSFPDYPKFSIWSDAYYVTANISSTNRVFAIERDKVLTGGTPQFLGFPLPGIRTSGFYSPQFFNVTNGVLPPAGDATIVYLQDDAWSGVSEDHLKLWTLNVDWETPANSTISQAVELITTPFISVFDGGGFSNRPQPSGPNIDILQATVMQQAQYRRFPGYNSALLNFVVDTDGSSAELAGIRWFELRQYGDGEPWEIYQEGTYISPYNGKDAFAGSMAMDGQGNIGMAYTTVSSQESIAIYYTGRYASDPLGTMTVDETLIAQGNSNNPSNRLADYVHLTLDPTDDKTFWHIAEYFMNNQRTDVVGVFQIGSDLASDVGAIDIIEPLDGQLSNEQQITIGIFNYGLEAQGNIPVGYFLPGGDTIIETYVDAIGAGETATYTFDATADMGEVGETYFLTVFTALDIDENRLNDTITATITYLYPNDIGVVDVVSPESGTGLTQEEDIVVKLKNFGAADQENFELAYNLNGIVVSETYTEIFPANSEIEFTFDTKADFSALGEYTLSAYTMLENDADNSNDTTTVTIVKSNCEPESNCGSGDAIRYVELRDLINESTCSETGYNDFTEMITDIEQDSENELILTVGYGNEYVKVWIDFNDNFIFEEDEIVVDDFVIAPGQSSGNYTDTISLVIPEGALLGEHLMRIKTNWNNNVPNDACESTNYGETEDYKVNVVLTTGNAMLPEMNSRLDIRPISGKQYEVSFITEKLDAQVLVNLHNSLGLNLIENKVSYANGKYSYIIDMSYAAPGVYIVRIGTHKYGKVSKLVIH
ncbi:MAG: GEVED domain-containing protein [Bacteroidales bacterium]|jgi:hypothetical protein|nr:GEVED domain-containing protein [Bacteroidales bacterium]